MTRCIVKRGANTVIQDNKGNFPLVSSTLNLWKKNKETLRIKFPLFIEITDFKLEQVCRNVIKLFDVLDLHEWCEQIAEYLAVLTSMNITVSEVILEKVFQQEKYKKIYSESLQELNLMKLIKSTNCWFTMYNLFMDDEVKLANYANNEFFLRDFGDFMYEISFPIFGMAIQRNVMNSIVKREMLNAAYNRICDLVPSFNPTLLPVRDIFDCFCTEDLQKFLEH